MMSRPLLVFAAFGTLVLAGCNPGAPPGDACLVVAPNEPYALSGTAMTMDFTPDAKTYTVRNSCDEDVTLSVEEDVRWLDVEIAAFGTAESGVLEAGSSVDVVVEVRYGNDNPQRLDQLAPGSYQADLRFVDDTNDGSVARSVELTVNAP